MTTKITTLQVKVQSDTFAARTAGAHGNSLQVSTCPSATAYESISTSLVDDSSAAVGDTIVTTDESDVFNVGDIIQFSTTASTDDFDDGDFYRVTAIAGSGETLEFVQHPRGAGGLKRAVADDSKIKRRWRYYDSVDRRSWNFSLDSRKRRFRR